MIKITQLTKNYNNHIAVDNVSFQLSKGQTLVLLGTSGSGKTTTLKMINKLILPSSGSIEINGENINNFQVELLRRKIGYVIQGVGLFPHYTIGENIAVVPKLLKFKPSAIKSRIEELLVKLHLEPSQFIHKYPHQLSGGQQQRVGLARALAANPPIILMDEPFAALDPITKQSIHHEFKHLEELHSKTTILVSHDIEEAFELADVIGLMHQGKLQQIGCAKDLLFAPANDFVAQFFATNRFVLEMKAITIKDIQSLLAKEILVDLAIKNNSIKIFDILQKNQYVTEIIQAVEKFKQEIIS